MDFLWIMGIGVVFAILIVIGSRPKRNVVHSLGARSPNRQFFPTKTPAWKKETSRSLPRGEQEYLEAIERYQNDPNHDPFPLPPPRGAKQAATQDSE